MHTFWITFYSYKGGVGRSMALANVAANLATQGRKVVMIDFDLEAPGLDSFEEFDIPPGKPGLVEYVCDYLDEGRPSPISNFVHEIRPRVGSESKKEKEIDGKLWMIASGAKNESYNQKRLSINWADLYESRSGAEFFENFKADIEETYAPDYVLIDSRTGLTDVGGVCTLHLPDLVVLLFALNEQNLQGIASVARVLRDSEKFPQIIPVATPVPNLQGGSEALLLQRKQRAKELLGTEIKHTLPYSAIVALKERIIVWDRPAPLRYQPAPLRAQYDELSKAIQEADPAGIDFLLRETEQAIENLELDRAKEIGEILRNDYSDRADSWLALADIAKSWGDQHEMERCLHRTLEIAPLNTTAFDRLEILLRSKKRYVDLLNLLGQTIDASLKVNSSLSASLRFRRGELFMRTGQPDKAVEDYQSAFAPSNGKEEENEEDDLPELFNLAEAKRRLTGEIHREDWTRIVGIFEKTSTGVSSLPNSSRANHTQAMHIAYACLANIAKAKELLEETAKVLDHVSRQERIFCVADYDNLPLTQFLQRNQEMLEALDRGELWDGMKLA